MRHTQKVSPRTQIILAADWLCRPDSFRLPRSFGAASGTLSGPGACRQVRAYQGDLRLEFDNVGLADAKAGISARPKGLETAGYGADSGAVYVLIHGFGRYTTALETN